MLINARNQVFNSNANTETKVRGLCELVRDILYKMTGSVDVADFIKNERGSCTPKHVFLAQNLQELGVPVKFLQIPFYYKDLEVTLPEDKLDLVAKVPLCMHTALKAKLSGEWVTIDVTWDSKLQGFPVNSDWDGHSNMKLAVVPHSITELAVAPAEFTKESLKYTEEEKEIKQEFYKFFDEFLIASRG